MAIAKEIEISELPISLSDLQAVELCYRNDLDLCVNRLRQGYRVLIRCEKGLNSYLFPALRKRIKQGDEEWHITLVDG